MNLWEASTGREQPNNSPISKKNASLRHQTTEAETQSIMLYHTPHGY